MMTADSAPSLTPNQILALVVLMTEARELTNNELKELAGFSLTGADNTKLEKLGLVKTDRSHRPYSHQLEDKGWHLVRELHTNPPPKAGGSAVRSLFTVLANVHRALDRLRISHAEFFKQSAQVTPVEDVVEPATTGNVEVGNVDVGDAEAGIRRAYRDLVRHPGQWVGLADLRDRLPKVDRSEVDEALRAMAQMEGVRIIPVANSKALDSRDRDAALRMGGEDHHALSIGPA